MAKTKSAIELKYSLLNEQFTKTVGKTRIKRLRDAISNWVNDKTKKNAIELSNVLINLILVYWKKTKLKDFKGIDITKDSDLIVDIVHKKGRKPNTIRLETDPELKKELLKLIKD